MHDYLYEHQQELDDNHLRQYASALGMDVARFDEEMAKHVHAGRVREDFMSGIRSGVNGTPTFYINGIRHDDSWDEKYFCQPLSKPLQILSADQRKEKGQQ